MEVAWQSTLAQTPIQAWSFWPKWTPIWKWQRNAVFSQNLHRKRNLKATVEMLRQRLAPLLLRHHPLPSPPVVQPHLRLPPPPPLLSAEAHVSPQQCQLHYREAREEGWCVDQSHQQLHAKGAGAPGRTTVNAEELKGRGRVGTLLMWEGHRIR